MDPIYLLVIVLLAALAVIAATHLRPLDEREVHQLACKRRGRGVLDYYRHSPSETAVDMDFKKRMNPSGQFYSVDERLESFPSMAAGLLKYKKHEWAVIGFERQRRVTLLWTNKGTDRSSVSIDLASERLSSLALQRGCSSVHVFHNHPNSDPANVDCSSPSSGDLTTAEESSEVLNEAGVCLLEYVCERGVPYRYHFSVPRNFLPVAHFEREIRETGGGGPLDRLWLHIERIFRRHASEVQFRDNIGPGQEASL